MANGQLDVASCARLIYEGFESYNRQFRRLTERARRRFEQRDWKGQIQDIGERVELYDKWCLKIQLRLRRRLGTGDDRQGKITKESRQNKLSISINGMLPFGSWRIL